MPLSHQRRLLLKGIFTTSTIGVAISAGLLTPSFVLAEWPESAFRSKKVPDALNGLFNSEAVTDTDKITVKSPDIAENGAVVPVSVKTDIENIEMVALLVSKNSTPLAATYEFSPDMKGFISTRVKVGQTCDLVAVVKSDGKLFTAKKAIKVTLGGCGG